MLRFPPVAALACLLGLAAPAAAQSGDTIAALTPGRRAYSFNGRSLEYGAAGAFGIWRVLAPDRSRGWVLDIGGSANHTALRDSISSSTTWSAGVAVEVGPRFRRYLAAPAPVAPFLETGLNGGLSYSRNTDDDLQTTAHVWSPSVGASLGVGAEWFPLRRISLAAQTGLQGTLAYRHASYSNFSSSSRSETWNATLQTFISALTVQLYF